jgi:Transcription-silencing protein Clr2
MKLLAVDYSYTITAENLLPYQAYAPSSELIQAIRELPWEAIDLRPETINSFNPCPPPSDMADDSGSRFCAAVTPYALAVQIAAKLATFWGITDEWDFKHLVPPGFASSATERRHSMEDIVSSLAYRNDSQTNGGSISAGSTMSRGIPESNTSSRMSLSDFGETNVRASSTLQYPPQVVSEKRYQGLWWGAERIWADDLVRLKVARRQFAPQGRPDIYPPAPPSQKTLEHRASSSSEPEPISELDYGAGGRGLFLKMEGLFTADVDREDGSVGKECRASGMLYELADEDWVDPHAEEHEKFALDLTTKRSQLSNNNSSSGPTANSVTPNTGLSQPIYSWPYPLPLPPRGFKFRPILTPGHEAVVSLTLLSGRYYPDLLHHPLILPTIEEAFKGPLHLGEHFWALEGLVAGYLNSVDPVKNKANRLLMVKDADKEAREDIEEACGIGREEFDISMEDGVGGMDGTTETSVTRWCDQFSESNHFGFSRGIVVHIQVEHHTVTTTAFIVSFFVSAVSFELGKVGTRPVASGFTSLWISSTSVTT